MVLIAALRYFWRHRQKFQKPGETMGTYLWRITQQKSSIRSTQNELMINEKTCVSLTSFYAVFRTLETQYFSLIIPFYTDKSQILRKKEYTESLLATLLRTGKKKPDEFLCRVH